MAGHSKWRNTKHRKAAQDSKKGKIFSKLIREAQVATKVGGEDIMYNSRLRVVLQKALSNNMAKHTFNRAIFHVSKNSNNNKKIMQNILYEGYGPGGTGVLLKCLTNNNRRLVAEIRYALSKFGGNLGTSGSVGYLFNKKGVISCISNCSEDVVIDAALKVGASDITVDENNMIKIYVNLELLQKMEVELQSYNVRIGESKIIMEPYVYIDLNKDDSLKLCELINMLKEINSVYDIYHNAKILTELI